MMPPTRHGSVVKSVDDSAAKSVAGYPQTLVLDDPSNTVPGWALSYCRFLSRCPTRGTSD